MDAEQQALNLKLCLYGGKESTIEKSFSGTTTLFEIQQELRKVFNVDSERETKLWINNSVYIFIPESNDKNGTDDDDAIGTPSLTSSDVKENQGSTNDTNSNCNNNNNNNNNNISNSNNIKATNNVSSSPIKPPPTPPAMPTNSSLSNNSTSPNVVTRQAAQSMNKQQQPIALPDAITLNSHPMLSATELLSSKLNNFISGVTNQTQTLSETGVADSSVVTLEVINSDGTWPSSRPRYGTVSTRSSKAQSGLCGLSNMGNTCFMNAALQCLSNSPPLTNYILTDKFVDDINTNNPLGMQGEIARTYAELIKVMWGSNHSSYLPREFKCVVSRFAPQFTGFSQQDCQELMAFLLDGLHEDLNRIKNKPYIEVNNGMEKRPDVEVAKESWENYKKRNDSIVVDTFHAMLKSTLICPECKLVSVTFDPFCYLSLPLPVKRERQVHITFLPAPDNLDESKIKTVLSTLSPEQSKLVLEYGGRLTSFHSLIGRQAGYASEFKRPIGCRMQVPRSGPASELCDIVARVINEERPDGAEKVKSDNLVVAETSLYRISKIYESSEHYDQISDEIVVIEKKSNYAVPLYLTGKLAEGVARPQNQVISELLFLHVPDLKYETLYQSIIVNLSNLTSDSEEDISKWVPLNAPTIVDHPMECQDDGTNEMQTGDCNGSITESETNGGSFSHKPAFSLNTVNSFGNHSFQTLGPNSKECDSSKLYLHAEFLPGRPAATPQFEHIYLPMSGPLDVFTPKVSPKPTLQLKDCITQFTNAERLGSEDPWFCPKCKKHQQAIKKFDVWSLPKVLIIHLKRFSFSRSWRDKIDTLVEFPVEGLDMSSYVHNPEQKKHQPILYDLIGVANHFGGLGGGHYTAFAKNAPLNSWYSFDDSLVSPTTANNVVTRSAYVLFYQIREK